MSKTIFIDTLYVVALINKRDQHHASAVEWSECLDGFGFVTTDAVLMEIGNKLARNYRVAAAGIIGRLLTAEEVQIVPFSTELLERAIGLYTSYEDKTWGLVDCMSFEVMRELGIEDALTFDQHFVQAGFHALMKSDS